MTDDWYGTCTESIYLWQYMDRGRLVRCSLSTLPLLPISIIVSSYLSTFCSSSSNWWSDGRSVSSSVRRHSSLESFERDGHHGETRINHQSGAWRGSSRDELFATSSTHRTVHFFFASAVMNVMLTMISLLVKDVVLIEKEERELIATPVVATLIPHIINHSSSSSCSCCRVP